MRRPVLYLAGMLLASGATLALATPASAASSPRHHCQNNLGLWGWHHHRHHQHGDHDYLNGNTYNGINILNGVLNGSGGVGLF